MIKNYKFREHSLKYLSLFFFFAILSNVTISYAQNAKVGRVSVKNDRWEKGGFFEGYSPNQEVLEKRSKTTKQFLNANGTLTTQIGGMIHYKDDLGSWQDIDYSVVKTNNSNGYKFVNETNEFKSYFPENAGSKAVKFKLNDQLNLNWWKNPKLEFSSNGTIVKSFNIDSQKGNSIRNTVRYNNVYPGVSEEFEVLPGGLENNTIINELTSEMKSLPANGMLNFSQVIELNSNWKVIADGKVQTKDFSSKTFQISIPGFEDGLTFSKIFVYDNTLTKEQALALVYSPKEKLNSNQLQQLNNHIYLCDYKAEFTNEGLKITTVLPVSWLKNSLRSFPVTIDPIVTIGSGSGAGDFRGPITHWYGFQRHADLYLQSEIGGYGIISSIEFYKTGTQVARTKPTKVFFRDTPAATLTGTDAWNSATYTGGLTASFDASTTQDATAGWKMITLTTGYSYSTGNLLVMTYDAFGGGGDAQYIAETNVAATQRQAFKRTDSTDPGDASATAVENYLPAIRITYLNPNVPTLTSFTPSSGCSNTGTVVITGTDFSGATSVTIGGTAVASYVINSNTQITAVVANGTTGVISVTTPTGSVASTGTFTVNPSPVVAAIAGGAATVCANGVTPAFTNATTGGVWGITNGTGSATISTGGIVSGTTVGTVIVTYAVSNGTCTTTVNYPVTVTAIPTPVSISGVISPACFGSIQTLTAVGGSVNSTFVNQTFSGATLPSGWAGVAGSGDTVAISTTNSAGGTANEVKITGNSFTSITDRLIYGPFNTSGLTTLNLQWANYVDWYSSSYNFNVKVQTSTDGVTWQNSSWGTNPVTADIGPGSQTATISTTDVGSTTLYIAFTLDGVTFGANAWYIDNVVISGLAPATILWSPTTGLYNDAAATIPYTGTSVTTVYSKPTVDTTYTVTATNAGGCVVTSAGAAIVVAAPTALPTGSSPQTFTTGQTIANLVVSGSGLLWYSNASGTTSIPTTTPLVNGTTYYVTQTLNGCPSVTLPIVVQEILGTNTFNNAGLTAYPNPVRDVLNLGYTTEISKIQVVNMLGQEVMVKNVNSNQTQVNLSNLASGSYLVKVSVDNQVKTIKVIKE